MGTRVGAKLGAWRLPLWWVESQWSIERVFSTVVEGWPSPRGVGGEFGRLIGLGFSPIPAFKSELR